MKLKDFFSKLKDQGKISSDEYDKFLESVPEGELPDGVFRVFENSFLTVERAKSDAKIDAHFRAQVLDGVDSWINDMIKEQIVPSSVANERDTWKKLKAVKTDFIDSLDRARKSTDSSDKDKKISDYEKSVRELTDKLNTANTEFNKFKSDKEAEVNKFKSDFELDYFFKDQIGAYTLAEEFQPLDMKRTVMDIVTTKLKKNHNITLDNGHPKVWEDNTYTKPKFNGNSEVAFKDLLDEEMKTFLKKNNSNQSQGAQPKPKPQQTSTNQTLKELRSQAV